MLNLRYSNKLFAGILRPWLRQTDLAKDRQSGTQIQSIDPHRHIAQAAQPVDTSPEEVKPSFHFL
jgi:hypothetical protein